MFGENKNFLNDKENKNPNHPTNFPCHASNFYRMAFKQVKNMRLERSVSDLERLYRSAVGGLSHLIGNNGGYSTGSDIRSIT